MTEPADDLPPILATVARAAGRDAALLIARVHGGTRVLIPNGPGRNWLTTLVGDAAAAAIVEALGPARPVDIPIGPEGSFAATRRARAAQFAELLARGAKRREMARALGMTERGVRKRDAARRARLVTDQGDLFES